MRAIRMSLRLFFLDHGFSEDAAAEQAERILSELPAEGAKRGGWPIQDVVKWTSERAEEIVSTRSH